METVRASDQGKLWATLSYGGHLLGLPLLFAPLIYRDDPFALYHAKHAFDVLAGLLVSIAVGAVGMFLSIPLFFVTCGLSTVVVFPLLMGWIVAIGGWFFVPVVHGLLLAQSGQWRARAGDCDARLKTLSTEIDEIEKRRDAAKTAPHAAREKLEALITVFLKKDNQDNGKIIDKALVLNGLPTLAQALAMAPARAGC